jgi:hypothetical protein
MQLGEPGTGRFCPEVAAEIPSPDDVRASKFCDVPVITGEIISEVCVYCVVEPVVGDAVSG